MGKHKLLDGATAVGASKAVHLPNSTGNHTVETTVVDTGATAFSALVVELQGFTGSRKDAEAASKTSVNGTTALAIGSTATQIAWGAFTYRIDDVNYSTASSASTALPIAHTIAASKYGVINVYMNAAGAITTKVPGSASAQLTAQSYTLDAAGAAQAVADAEAVVAPVGYVYIGRILIQNNGVLWTAGTNNMTNASDVTTAQFFSAASPFVTLTTHTFAGAEITNRAGISHTVDKHASWVRLLMSTVTGTVAVTSIYESDDKG